MNQRISSILQTLKDGNTTISALAEQFQVSPRTIRNDLKEVGRLLRQNDLPDLSLQSGGKVVPPENFSEFLPVLLPADLYAYKLSKAERAQAAAVMLTASPGYVTLAEIADTLLVSRATVINDLPDIRGVLEQGGLPLLSRADKGLSVEGKKGVKRRFLLRTVASARNRSTAASASRRGTGP